MRTIEKLAQLTRKELEESAKAEKEYTQQFRRAATRPQAALGAQRAQVLLGAMGGGTIANLLARGSRYARRHKGKLSALGAIAGALGTGASGMMPVMSKRQAAKEFPYEEWGKVPVKD